MPEGHKTHFLAQQHRERLGGQHVRVTSPQGRFRPGARRVSGRVLDTVRAVGKHMFYEFDGNLIVHVHLGRYGKFREFDSPPPAPVGQVRMRMIGTDSALDLNGPTTCRLIDRTEQQAVIDRLGPDPLGGGTKREVWEKISRSRKPIGALLLDQSLIAGVGNIFRAEILFETEIDPNVPGTNLTKPTFDLLWRSLTTMMKRGLKYGRIIAVTAKEAGMPLTQVEGEDRFRIYGKSDCPRCGGDIETIELAARRLYVCHSCQTRQR
ncbi:MAG: Fpg/Nei family DNA glycosylase [Rubripirellula sp.]